MAEKVSEWMPGDAMDEITYSEATMTVMVDILKLGKGKPESYAIYIL